MAMSELWAFGPIGVLAYWSNGAMGSKEKKILVTASKFLGRSIPFYEKNIALSESQDMNKLPEKIRVYVDSSRAKLKQLDFVKAKWQLQSAYVILGSPIPEKIKVKKRSKSGKKKKSKRKKEMQSG